MYIKLGLFIGGKWIYEAKKGEDVLNPFDESVLGWLPHATEDNLNDAVKSAEKGFDEWRNTDPETRGRIILKAADILSKRISAVSEVMTLEQGKPLAESAGEINQSIAILKFNGTNAKLIKDDLVADRENGLKTLIKPQPLGVCLCLTAWNFPIALVIRKIAPALAAGCSVIIKPSEETPGTAVEVVKIFLEAGLPKDVINLVFGVPHEISDYLLSRDEVKKVSFTGSVPVGKLLAKKSAETLKRCTLELGGHSPAIIAEDADIEATLDTLTGFKFRNAGQVCIAPSRFYVHEKIYDQVKDGFLKRIKNIILGNGMNEGVSMGPLSNSRRVDAMKDFVDDAVKNGSNIIYGGSRYKGVGYFWEPTLIENINEGSKMMTQEIFGPILPLFKFKDYDDVIEKANSLNFGLASYVYTTSKTLQEKMAKEIIAGGVSINTAAPMHPEIPYGGIKESGIGYEGGMDAIYSYIHKKNINII
ncbi:MAG: NAD-dependent succinate-semialdehyde dehydrogenase [Alphaproteobacteria bacterium]|nr:NAD-dependent succinate-semialdehyde dehydrogenase [Alphaproteobacteria bacterium]